MNIKASGRSALIIAAGFWICASAPLHAAGNDAQASEQTATVGTAVDTSTEPVKATRHHSSRKNAAKSHKGDRQAARDAKKSAEDDTAKAEDNKPADSGTGITSAVANANAQWPTDNPTTATNLNTQADSAPAPMVLQPEQPAIAAPDGQASNLQVVASDQLNELDRAATDSHQPPLTLAKATIDAPAEEATSSSNSPWDKTSMVGKIFVAFGGLLTMASAARMFMT
jgi:hypothetical protein